MSLLAELKYEQVGMSICRLHVGPHTHGQSESRLSTFMGASIAGDWALSEMNRRYREPCSLLQPGFGPLGGAS